ncbi:MAG: 3-dehydroquinate synthase [Candidatus Marinimicrobia bacterium]|nr:3-dehydroquinate synthase [Candidatus Neomarinimicrobiota bacterium]MDD5582078.1 3-dehydroquinate synthase [Candidatus Neomarinimicrobiota bacterium]
MHKIRVDLHERSYPIYVKNGILPFVGSILKQMQINPCVALISSKNVSALYKDVVELSLVREGFNVNYILMPSGEANKNLETVQYLYDKMLDLKIDRGSTVIALGGGVVGDTAGFLAATLYRGLTLVQIPTTLLAQVDSSIGGKVGINHPRGKNLIGAIYQPKIVIVDPTVLKTLDFRQRVSGFGEVIKYGFIRDRIFTQFLLENSLDILSLKNLDHVNAAIIRAIEIKSFIVSADEYESNLRMVLNFGHTIGHAIEQAAGYGTYTHGEAVIIGMCGALNISAEMGLLPAETAKQYIQYLQKIPIPGSLKKYSNDNMYEAITHDKKIRDGKIQFVLLQKIGDAVIRNDVPKKMIYNTFDWLKELHFAKEY